MTLMDFGETLELSETPCGRSVRRRCVYTSKGVRAIRLPSCFLLYQIFARVAAAARIAPDRICRVGRNGIAAACKVVVLRTLGVQIPHSTPDAPKASVYHKN